MRSGHEHAIRIRRPYRGQAGKGRGGVAVARRRAAARSGREEGTVDWYAARTSETTFWIFDTFETEEARQAHVNGQIAAALMANADELLATPPEIMAADVLAAK